MPMSTELSAGRVRSTYEFIKSNRDEYSVQAMCRVLGVAPSGYYEWLAHPVSNRAREDARLFRLIRASFTASQSIYGAPRVFLDLREAGETCSKHRVTRLMRVNHLRALRGYRTRRWSVGKPSILIPNLLQRQFTVTRRNKAWVTDITYIRTWQGWLYLAVVMDLFSRKIVGWSAGPTIHRELVLDAVLMAVRRRRPRGAMIHSDQGTQYGSDAWRRFCRSNHLEPSMSRKGNCSDNAVAESFFSSLKKERIKKQIYKNRDLALTDVADYIDRLPAPLAPGMHGVHPLTLTETRPSRRSKRASTCGSDRRGVKPSCCPRPPSRRALPSKNSWRPAAWL
jgi:putative transposase